MKALVTGGGGFLGRAVVEQLLTRGDEVSVLARGSYPELDAMGAHTIRGDLQDPAAAGEACRGMDVVFHIAAKAGYWGSWDEYYGANVQGTAHILDGCRKYGAPRLVYCSSPSVIFDGRNQEGVNEHYPYPPVYESFYPQTKAMAEQMALKANSPDLLTVALRPHLIFGPRDRHLLPAVLRTAKKGLLPQVGDGGNRVDLTFVEDAARAHLLAADRLEPGSPAAGSVYFISQGEPIDLWPWVRSLLERLEFPPIRLRFSLPAARRLGGTLEWIQRNLALKGEPRLTRFLASELAQSHWYDISRARSELGYTPQHSMAEALEITLPYLESLPE